MIPRNRLSLPAYYGLLTTIELNSTARSPLCLWHGGHGISSFGLAARGDSFRKDSKDLRSRQCANQPIFLQCIDDWHISLFAGQNDRENVEQPLVWGYAAR